MKKHIRIVNRPESEKAARLWKLARTAMDDYQHNGVAGKRRRLLSLLDYLKVPPEGKVLDASCGAGHTFCMSSVDRRKWSYSDGDSEMLALAVRSNPEAAGLLSRGRIKQAFWHELPDVFNDEVFDLVLVLGNSLPYTVNWSDGKPDQQIISESQDGLLESLASVLKLLGSHGRLLFDIIKPGNRTQRLDLGEIESDGQVLHPFIHARHENGIRYWTVGTENETLTIRGLSIDIDYIRRLLSRVGYTQIGQVPEKFEVDPAFYELHVASR